MRLGFHLSIAGSLLKAISQAQVLGCQALQIFVQNPRGWKWRPVAPGAIRAFTAARRRAGLGPLMVHLSYLPNLAAADPVLYQRSAARLSQELALARELEADYLVIHPGHGDLTETSFRLVAQALAAAVSRVPPPPLVLLENTAGQGNELGWRIEHLQRLMELSGVELGLCLDTAHAFASGYDLRRRRRDLAVAGGDRPGPRVGALKDAAPQRLPGGLQFPGGPALAPGTGADWAGGAAAVPGASLAQPRWGHHGDPEAPSGR